MKTIRTLEEALNESMKTLSEALRDAPNPSNQCILDYIDVVLRG